MLNWQKKCVQKRKKKKKRWQGVEDIIGFADADWGANPDDRKSYTGYIFIFANCSVSWETRKQQTVALSSTEA
jgi:hypothetical protein